MEDCGAADTTIQAASARQGGGTAPISDRKVFCAIVYALTTSCAWRRLPPCFGVSPATAHRRFTAWKEPVCAGASTTKSLTG
ncbi:MULTISPECIES: transposase [unclassified Streptomyces]|uniref:transposase n=1 Tax=unclassified Streptomyces TaxID=2593676 RepID=UPI0035B1844E